MEFEDFSQDFNDLWNSDYGEGIKGSCDIFDLSYLLDGGQATSPAVVLNDRLMTEASLGLVSQVTKTAVIPIATPIKCEHSYSLNRERLSPEESGSQFLDIDEECFPAVSIAEAEGTQTLKDVVDKNIAITNVDDLSSDIRDIDSSSDTMSCCDDADFTDEFTLDGDPLTEACQAQGSNSNGSPTVTSNNNGISILSRNSQLFDHGFTAQTCNPEINKTDESALACSINSSLPGFTIGGGFRHICVSSSPPGINQNYQNTKNSPSFSIPISEQSYLQSSSDQGETYPPTPPSSSSSDSESFCTSPPRTPLYETLSPQYCSPIKKFCLKSSRTPISTPLISSQPKGAIGAINLTEEEKRTLISEGYPIPSKLPLTKTEEKSLKKIRRKIKNKISAQESRRKKKEYMDKLEGKVEDLETENGEYKKRIAILQKKNTSLQHELNSLQEMVARDEGRRSSDSDCSLNL